MQAQVHQYIPVDKMELQCLVNHCMASHTKAAASSTLHVRESDADLLLLKMCALQIEQLFLKKKKSCFYGELISQP